MYKKILLYCFVLVACINAEIFSFPVMSDVPKSITVSSAVATPIRLGTIVDFGDVNGTNVYFVDLTISNDGEMWAPVFGIGSSGFSVASWRKLSTTLNRSASSLSGSRELVNKVLGSMKFQCSVSCSIFMTLTTSDATIASEKSRHEIPITVIPVTGEYDEAVQVVVPIKVDHISEDSLFRVTGLSVISSQARSSYEMILSVDRGFLEVIDGITREVQLHSYGSVLQLRVTDVAALNRVLQSIIYTPPQDYSGAVRFSASVVMHVEEDDANDGKSYASQRSFFLFVDAVDDAPLLVLRSPCPWVMGEKIQTLYQPVSLSCFGIIDSDGSPAPLLVDVTSDRGIVKIDNSVCSAASLVSRNGTSDTSVVFLVSSNEAMDAIGCVNLIITEAGTYKARVTVTVTSFAVSVNGNGAPDWSTLPVEKAAVTRRSEEIGVEIPKVLVAACPEKMLIRENESFVFGSVCEVLALHASNDESSELLLLSITTYAGRLSVANNEYAHKIASWNVDDHNVDVVVTFRDVANALTLVTFHPNDKNSSEIILRAEMMNGDASVEHTIHVDILLGDMGPKIIFSEMFAVPTFRLSVDSLALDFATIEMTNRLPQDEEPWFTMTIDAYFGQVQCAAGLQFNDILLKEYLLLEKCSDNVIVHGTAAALSSFLQSKAVAYVSTADNDVDSIQFRLVDSMNMTGMDSPLIKTLELQKSLSQSTTVLRTQSETIYLTEHEVYSFGLQEVSIEVNGLHNSTICYLTVSASSGVIIVPDSSWIRNGEVAITTTTSLTGQPTIHVTGRISGLQQVLQVLEYSPNAESIGSVSIIFFLRFGPNTTSASLSLYVYAVNDPPMIHHYSVDRRPFVQVDNGLLLRDIGLHVSDPDIGIDESASSVTTTLSANCGSFVLSMTSLITLQHASSVKLITANAVTSKSLNGCHDGLQASKGYAWGYGHIALTGPISDVNAIIGAIEYHAPRNSSNRFALISVTVNDNGNVGMGGPLTAEEDIILSVENAISPISLNAAVEVFMDEGNAYLPLSQHISLTFPEESIRTRCTFAIVAKSLNRGLVADEFGFHSIRVWDGNQEFASGSYTLTDSLGMVAQRVSLMSLAWHDNYHGVSDVQFTLSISRNSIETVVSADSTRVIVSPINNAPEIVVRETSYEEDIPGRLPFHISDVDVEFLANSVVESDLPSVFDTMTRFEVRLNCYNCFFIADAITTNFNVSGPLGKVNDLLDQWRVQGNADFYGEMIVSVLANDLGSYGRGHSLSTQKDIHIAVTAVNDPPAINLLPMIHVAEGGRVKITSLDHDPLIDVDASENEVYRVTISCEFGFVGLAGNVSEHVGVLLKNDREFAFESTLFWANLTIGQIIYQAVDHVRVQDVITVIASDGFGASATETIAVFITSVNLPSVIQVSSDDASLSVLEDTIASFPRIRIEDIDTTFTGAEVLATVTMSHSATLEVQKIQTVAQHVDAIQVIECSGESVSENVTFQLMINVDCGSGLSFLESDTIFASAVASREDERDGFNPGAGIAESMEDKIETMLQSCFTDVSVHREDVYSNETLQTRLWHVTFHEVAFDFPLIMVANVSSGTHTIAAYTSRAGNRLGGWFSLIFGSDETSNIAHDASAEQVARALMDLPSIEAVSVERSSHGLENGFVWLVTFFAVSFPHNAYHSRLPLLRGNSTLLTGDWILEAPQQQSRLMKSEATTERIVSGNGLPRVATASLIANHIDEVIEVAYTFTIVENSHPAFTLRFNTADSRTICETGPVFATTVPMRHNEQVGPYPPHAQVAGTKEHESLQHLIESCPLFFDLAATVTVTKEQNVRQDGSTRISWFVTFHGATGIPFLLTTKQNDFALGNATVHRKIWPNVIGGEFTLSYGSYSTQPLPYDASANVVEHALMDLPSIRDPATGIGAVQVGRRGPSPENGYTWFIAFIQEAEFTYDLAVGRNMDSQVQLTGQGARLKIAFDGLRQHQGLRLGSGVNGLRNKGMSSLFDASDSISFSGAPSSVADALSHLQYSPQTNWNGIATAIIRVSDGYTPESMTVTTFPIHVVAANDPPIIMWRAIPLTNNSELVVFEDADVLIGGEFVLNTGENVTLGSMSGIDIHRDNAKLGLQIIDCDASEVPIQVSISCTEGVLHVDSPLLTIGSSTSIILNGNTRHALPAYLAEGVRGSTLEMSGDVYAINDVLNTLKYQSELDFYGYDSIMVTINDGVSETHGELRIKVLPVNDAPVIDIIGTKRGILYDNESSWPVGIFETEEDALFELGSQFTITDVDMKNMEYSTSQFGKFADSSFVIDYRPESAAFEVVVTVSNGVLHILDHLGVEIEYSEERSDENFGGSLGFSKVRVIGKYNSVLNAVSRITYTPDKHWYGHDLCEIFVNDMGNRGYGGARKLTRRFIISVFSAADAPVILLPSSHALRTFEDAAGIIGAGETHEVVNSVLLVAGLRLEEVVNISAASIRIVDPDMRQQLRDTRFIVRAANNTSRNPLSNDPKFNYTYADPATVDIEHFILSPTFSNENYIGTMAERESSIVRVELNVFHGTLSLHRVNDDVELLHGSGLHDDRIILRGPIQAVNIALQAVIYQPDLNWNSRRSSLETMVHDISTTERLEITVIDSHGGKDSTYIDIIVDAINDPPVVGLGQNMLHDFYDTVRDEQSKMRIHSRALQCIEDSLCPLLQLWVRDVDAKDEINGALKITMTSSNGSLVFDPLYETFPHIVSSGLLSDVGSVLEIVIPATDINLDLIGVNYQPNKDFFGRDSIIITVNDMGNTGSNAACDDTERCMLSDSIIVPVFVEGKPDTPVIIVPMTAVEIIEDESFLVSDVYVLDSDRSPYIDKEKLLSVSLTSSDGKLLLPTIPLNIDLVIGTPGKLLSHIEFVGNGDDVNDCLKALVFQPSPNFNSLSAGRFASIHITVADIKHSADFGELASSHVDIYYRILPANDYPMVILPGSTERPESLVLPHSKPRYSEHVEILHLDEDSPHQLHEIYFYDVDFDGIVTTDGSSLWTATFQCEHCSFDTLNYTTRRVMNLSNSGTQCVIQSRSITQLNDIASRLIYTPSVNYFGNDVLAVSICDDGLLCDKRFLPISIRSINDAPEWTIPEEPIIVQESSTLLLGSLVFLNDVDATEGDMTISIEVDYGSVTLPTLPASLSVLNGTGEADSLVTLAGTLSALQRAIALMIYTPPSHWNSQKTGVPDIIHFLVDDGGHSSHFSSDVGKRLNSLQSADEMLIIVSEKAGAAPTVNVPGAVFREFPCESREGRSAFTYPDHPPPKHVMCRSILSIETIIVMEDTVTSIPNVSIENNDVGSFNNANVIEVILTVMHGHVLLPEAKLLGIDFRPVAGMSAGSVSIMGRLGPINACLENLRYAPALNYHGPDYLSIHATDRRYFGNNGPFSTNETIPLIVQDVPDAPAIIVPSNFETIAEDHRLIITGIHLVDNDFIEIVAGRPTYNRHQDYTDTFTWNETQTLNQDSKMLRVEISANHGSVMLLSFKRLQIIDIPTVAEESTRLSELPISGTTELRKRYTGTEHNSSVPTNAASSLSDTYAWWRKVTFEGRLHDMNKALQTITYQPDTNWNSEIEDEYDILKLSVTDLVNSPAIPEVVEFIKINVLPVQDAPVITMPGEIRDARRLSTDLLSSAVVDVNALFIEEDSHTTIKGVEIRSVDAQLRKSDEFVRVEISTCHGTTRLPKVERSHLLDGMIVERGALVNGSDLLVFRAPLSLVNYALSEIQFSPTKNYFGTSACLTITVSNVAERGIQLLPIHENADKRYIRIIVNPKNDPPAIIIPADTGGLDIFSVNGGSFIRIEGARNWNSNGHLADNPRGQSGYELWRLKEPTSLFDRSQFGLGHMEWSFKQVSDINPGIGSSHPQYLITYKDYLYFQADDGVHGSELWRETVGQAPGTPADDTMRYPMSANLFADLYPGHESSEPSYLAIHEDVLYFSARGVDTSWMLDAGRVDQCGGFRQSTYDNRVFYGVSESNVWDPKRVYECPHGYHWASTAEALQMMTVPYDHDHDHMWHSYGVSELGLPIGKQFFRDAGEFETATSVGHENEPNSYMNQCGWDGYEWGGLRRTHFLFSDSAHTKAYKHAGQGDSIRPSVDRANSLEHLTQADFAGIICIAGEYDTSCRSQQACHQGSGQELWRTDGTYEGTWRVADIVPGSVGSRPRYLTSFGHYLYFAAETSNGGHELFRSTGEIGSAELISLASKGLRPGVGSSDPAYLVVAGGKLFFAATTHDFGRELWMASLPGEGGLEWFDVVHGKGSSSPNELQSSGGNLPLFFAATDPVHGRELWVSDGTRGGTMLVKDINKGIRDSNPKYLTWFKNKLFFQAEDASHGRELWSTDGTAAGTRMLVDIRWGRPSSAPSHLTVLRFQHRNEDYLVFTASDGLYVNGAESGNGYEGSQLWRTDGTKGGTQRIFQNTGNDFYFDHAALDAAYPSVMGVMGSELFVPANRGTAFLKQPFGGFDIANEESVQGINQAIVVSDVDTAPEDFVSVTMSVTNGFIVLPTIPKYSTSEFPSDRNMTFLVVDDEVTNRILLANALRPFGNVLTAKTGKEAYDMTVAANGTIDCILMDVRMPFSFDGLQATRLIRLWEQQIRDREISGRLARQDGVVIIGTGATNSLSFDVAESLGAGMNEFFQRPFKDYVGPERTYVGRDGPEQRSFVTIDTVQDEQESIEYETFVDSILKYLEKEQTTRDMVQVSTLVSENITIPSEEVLAGLPGKIIGSSVTITGTLVHVNIVLRSVYFFAPDGTSGDVYMSVTATDKPPKCSVSSVLIDKPLPSLSKFEEIEASLCDRGSRSAVGTSLVRIVIIGRNRPPEVLIEATGEYTAEVNTPVALAGVSVFDSDFEIDAAQQTDTFGIVRKPPVTVYIEAESGSVDFPLRDYVAIFIETIGERKRTVLFGPIDAVNAALAQMVYSCTIRDGCFGGLLDRVVVVVDDGGFVGFGGALQATVTLQVNIVE